LIARRSGGWGGKRCASWVVFIVATASDLAIARAESREIPLGSTYLNSLVIRAHGRIYRADAQGANAFACSSRASCRERSSHVALHVPLVSVFMIFSIVGFVGTRYDPEFSELVGVSPTFREMFIETQTHCGNDSTKRTRQARA
jgi:hypothetical protein